MIEIQVETLKNKIKLLIANEKHMLAVMVEANEQSAPRTKPQQEKMDDIIAKIRERISLYEEMLIEADLVVDLRGARELLSKFA